MKRSILIQAENAKAICEALEAVNGRAYVHTFSTFEEINDVAKSAERALNATGVVESKKAGALYVAHSGSRVANRYEYSRVGNSITLRRSKVGWMLEVTKICKTSLSTRGGKSPSLFLTKGQDEFAVQALKRRYEIRSK